MQPQQQPQDSNKQFDFMLKNNQPAKRGFGAPRLPKPLLIGVVVLLGIIVLVVFSTITSGRKNATYKPMLDSVARAAEIVRVTKAVQTLGLQDPSINATSNTVYAVLNSDTQQMTQYLAKNGVKLSSAQLKADADATVDAQMKAAQQSNSLDQAYITYLQQYLPRYQSDLSIAYKSAKGPKGQAILQAAFDSETALLGSPPIKP